MKFKWERSWYNWRKTAANSTPSVNSTIGNQKVASSGIPMGTQKPSLISKSSTFLLSPTLALTNKIDSNIRQKLVKEPPLLSGISSIPEKGGIDELVNMNVSAKLTNTVISPQFETPINFLDPLTGNNYAYAYSLNKNNIMVIINNAATSEENRVNNGAGHFVTDFNKARKDFDTLYKNFPPGVSLACVAVVFAIAGAAAESKAAYGTAVAVLALFGLHITPIDLSEQYYTYKADISSLNNDFWQVMSGR